MLEASMNELWKEQDVGVHKGPLGVTGPSSPPCNLYNYTGPSTQKGSMIGLRYCYLHLKLLNFIFEIVLCKFGGTVEHTNERNVSGAVHTDGCGPVVACICIESSQRRAAHSH